MRSLRLMVAGISAVTLLLPGMLSPNRAVAASPPVLSADATSVTTNENTLAVLTGTFSDPDGDEVSLTASEGTIDRNDPKIGNWRWTLPALDGPYSSTVTLTAEDESGATTSLSFALTIKNVAPTAWTRGPAFVPVASKAPRYFEWTAFDVAADTLTTTLDCGSGTFVDQGGTSTESIKYVRCTFPTAGSTLVGVRSSDEDGGSTDGRMTTRATSQVRSVADAHLVINGAPTEDWAGGATAAVDLTGDGKAEVAIGMGRPAGYGPGTDPRFVQVILGRSAAGTLDMGALAAGTGFRVIGTGGDEVGASLAAAGDVNGDGRDDLVIGAPLASPEGRTFAGAAYVLYGSASTQDVELATLPASRGFRIAGAAGTGGAGRTVAGVGDVNGDGYDDIAVWTRVLGADISAATIILGGPSIAGVDLDALDPSRGFRISGPGGLGRSIAGADVNGDGRSDIVLGGTSPHSRAVVVYGTSSPVDVDPTALASSKGFTIGTSGLGVHDVAAGDMDGDGYADIAIGHEGGPFAPVMWTVSVIRGGKTNASISELGAAPATRVKRILGSDAGLGYGLAMADFRRDGRMELLVGAVNAQHNGSLSGSMYVIFGKASLTNVDLTTLSTSWLRIDGDGPYVRAAAALGAGDVTGDGVPDLVIGSPGYPTLTSEASGRVGVFAGTRSETTAPTATAPVHRIPTAVALTAGKPTVTLTWSGSDTGSGIGTYELSQSVNGGAWTSVGTGLRLPSSNRVLATGKTYRFRVRATDRAGNVSKWAFGPTFRLSGIQETSASTSYTGTWPTATSTSYWGGATRRSTTAGSRMTVRFTGSSISLVAPMGPTRGSGQVYVNGSYVGTVSLYSSSGRPTRVIKTWRWSTSATRTLSIRVVGTSGHPRFDVDGFVIVR